jgi:hypothetical protein
VISIDEGERPFLADKELSGAGFASPLPVRPGTSTVSAYVHIVFALQ